ncbi:hypothetical protein GEV33_008433 [Tenebrio molitor]|uniref:Uncharacterized protein n=1 Tax=Tenebrio molitor TaxID=7067 RepID=A0A8J6LC97_TENMO|nr:hypothetical protein GEV33_008433 [Tenebrio molitor]
MHSVPTSLPIFLFRSRSEFGGKPSPHPLSPIQLARIKSSGVARVHRYVACLLVVAVFVRLRRHSQLHLLLSSLASRVWCPYGPIPVSLQQVSSHAEETKSGRGSSTVAVHALFAHSSISVRRIRSSTACGTSGCDPPPPPPPPKTDKRITKTSPTNLIEECGVFQRNTMEVWRAFRVWTPLKVPRHPSAVNGSKILQIEARRYDLGASA